MVSTACPAPIVTLFHGGSYNGSSMSSLTCGPLSIIFKGGPYDGTSSVGTSCAVAPAIYKGGSYDGFALSKTSCLPVGLIFKGGPYDGFSMNNASCAVSTMVYTGGSYSGFSMIQDACPTPAGSIYSGGPFDGNSRGAHVDCASIFSFVSGGIKDGASVASTGCVYPLPVELLYFNAQLVDAETTPNVLCTWATASEMNNDYFTVEKTIDFFIYEKVGIVQGKGNSTQYRTYSFVDPRPYPGTSYYRLKQTDFNGNEEFSRSVSVDLNKSTELSLEVFPNPVTGAFINVTISGSRNEEVKVSVIDLLGKQQYAESVILRDGVASVAIKNDDFTAGIYYVVVNSGATERVFKKIVIQQK